MPEISLILERWRQYQEGLSPSLSLDRQIREAFFAGMLAIFSIQSEAAARCDNEIKFQAVLAKLDCELKEYLTVYEKELAHRMRKKVN